MLRCLSQKLLESYQRRNGRASIFLSDTRVELWLSRWVDDAWTTTRFTQEIESGLQGVQSSVPIFFQRALAELEVTTPYLSLYLADYLVDYRNWGISDAFAGRKRREYGLWKASQAFPGQDGDQAVHLFPFDDQIQYFRHPRSISALVRRLEELALVARVHPMLHAFALTGAAAPVCLMCLGSGRWWSHIALVDGRLVFQRSHVEQDVEEMDIDGDAFGHLMEFVDLVRHFGEKVGEGIRPAITVSESFVEALRVQLGQSCTAVSVKEEALYKKLHGSA